MLQTKEAFRDWAKIRRSELDLPTFSAQIVQQLAIIDRLRNAEHILIYLAIPEEIHVEAIVEKMDKCWYAPRIGADRRLTIHSYVPNTPNGLTSGVWGIREPNPDVCGKIEPTVLDAVIVPSLVLSKKGDRIGYGGGYYDRFLPLLRPDCLKIGDQAEDLVVDTLPVDSWDVHLDLVVTESEIYICN